jgi:hypothetical protein
MKMDMSNLYRTWSKLEQSEKEKEMAKFKSRRERKAEQAAVQTETESSVPVEETVSEETPQTMAEIGDKIEAAGGEIAPQPEAVTSNTRGVIPDQFGNNVKGERYCKECGVKESVMLEKNPRYSLCKGLCVNCYGKQRKKTTKPEDMTVDQIQAKIKHYQGLLDKKLGEQGRVEDSAITSTNEDISSSTINTHGASVDDEALAEISH